VTIGRKGGNKELSFQASGREQVKRKRIIRPGKGTNQLIAILREPVVVTHFGDEEKGHVSYGNLLWVNPPKEEKTR